MSSCERKQSAGEMVGMRDPCEVNLYNSLFAVQSLEMTFFALLLAQTSHPYGALSIRITFYIILFISISESPS